MNKFAHMYRLEDRPDKVNKSIKSTVNLYS